MGAGRRYDYLLDALDYGDELTPEENWRRINALRSDDIKPPCAGSSLPGQAPNAGRSAGADPGQHPVVARSAG